MIRYKSTIVNKHSEYAGKVFLLISRDKKGLFKDPNCDDSYIEVKISNKGELSVFRVSRELERNNIDSSLRGLGQKYLGLNDPSVSQMLRFLVVPEMEIERIFNCLRYKYLSSLKFGYYEPREYITADCNDLFKALIQAPFRGIRKEALCDKWKTVLNEERFPKSASINIKEERNALDFVIRYMRPIGKSLYNELIAIKPGFHEMFMDKQHGYEHGTGIMKKEEDSRRIVALKMIHNIYGGNHSFTLKNINLEINAYRFLTYAPCTITEGPFVFRKKISVSYFDEIRKLRTKKDLERLGSNFFVLDYCNADLDTKSNLGVLLKKAKKFTSFN